MKPLTTILGAGLLGLVALAAQQNQATAPGAARPRQVPVPAIETTFPSMPGVEALPSIDGLPDVMRTTNGRPVKSAADWKARREEMKQVLPYYAVGRMPPPPGNVTGAVLGARRVAGGGVRTNVRAPRRSARIARSASTSRCSSLRTRRAPSPP